MTVAAIAELPKTNSEITRIDDSLFRLIWPG